MNKLCKSYRLCQISILLIFACIGYGQTCPFLPKDCDDGNAAINPGAKEVCSDGIDNNCDGQVDENCGPSWPQGAVHCNGTPTEVVELISPTTGRIWMDRNLGATRAATSSTDTESYGDLYQWGRFSDGHQCRDSATTTTPSNTDTPSHGQFNTTVWPYDWRSPQNDNLWQGVDGVNNPCPTGYRLPTTAEWQDEGITKASTALQKLKLPLAGFRSVDGSLNALAYFGYYWSSTVNTIDSRNLLFNNDNTSINPNFRAFGVSVRCIKD